MAKKKAAAAPPTTEEPVIETPSTYTVVARRYRPKQFTELVGQESVGQALANAIKTNRVAHAYLFTGPRGVGKTSTARILAKCLNCEKGPTFTPCDQCDICLGITSGEDIDVIEIDGASNGGIDRVRDIRQNVQTRPSRARYKIYIIDEVHMVTVPAFNALLKTLEEPPAHVKFLFATTEVQKIPVTILSRCQRFDLGTITTAKIVERLKSVVEAEGMQADPEALLIIARRAAGSMRDAQSLLDQLLSYSQDKLSVEQVHELLGSAGEERIVPLVLAVLENKPSEALAKLAEYAEQGLLFGELLDQLIEFYRLLMIVACGTMKALGDTLPEAMRNAIEKQSQKMSVDAALAGLDVLSTAKARLRNSNHPQLIVEMALVRLCRLGDLIPVGQLARLISSEGASAPATNAIGSKPLPPAIGDDKKKVTIQPRDLGNGNGATDIETAWQTILSGMGPMQLANLNRANRTVQSSAHRIELRFPSSQFTSFEFSRQPPAIDKMERDLETLTGQKWSVKVELEEGSRSEFPQGSGQTPAMSRQAKEERLKTIPLTNRILEKLNGRVLQMDEGFGEEGIPVSVASPDEIEE